VYTLTFSNAEFSTHADCASCRGTFMLTGATLVTGPIVLCTSVNCPETDFQSRYRMLLSGSNTVTVEDNRLALSSPRGVLRFRR
jgi:heat shock protein HslJ